MSEADPRVLVTVAVAPFPPTLYLLRLSPLGKGTVRSDERRAVRGARGSPLACLFVRAQKE